MTGPGLDVAQIRAPNPSPFTLSGTNTWVAGRGPAYVIDPGPAIEEHIAAVAAEAHARGGLGAILLTHDHADHSEGVAALRELSPAPLAAARGEVDRRLSDGDELGPLRVYEVPGHAPDHLAFVAGAVCFTGDAVLGEGSVFVAPDPGAMTGYLAALARLRELPLELLCPGHGPPVTQASAKLDEYIAHRLDRERRLVDALARGLRTSDELLDAVWDDAPAQLRIAAAVTLESHLHKLEEEDRLPAGVERQSFDWLRDAHSI